MWIHGGAWLALALSGCTASDDGATGDASDSGASSPSGSASQCEDEGWLVESGEDGAADTSFGMGDDMPLPVTIEQVQRGEVGEGTWIAIAGVVAVTPAAPSEVRPGRELFVQDPAGGAYSGLRVVARDVDLGQLLAPGDAADLVGRVIERDDFVLLEVGASRDVVRLGPAALPEPTQVAIEELDADAPTARQYEGVVVQIADATVTDTAPCDGEFVLDDIVRVDDRFVPGQLPTPSAGTAVTSVRGVFVRASGSYELAPPEPGALH